jgi:hypothetical protein
MVFSLLNCDAGMGTLFQLAAQWLTSKKTAERQESGDRDERMF